MPDRHRHEWIEAVGASGAPAFLDLAYRGSAQIEGRNYPVVLLRYLRGAPVAKAMIVDVRMAIDCEGHAMSGLEISRTTASDDATGMRLSQQETLSVPFTAVYRQNEARVAPLFKHACGPDWSMKDSE